MSSAAATVIRRLLLVPLIALGFLLPQAVSAQVIADWGTVSTPVTSDVTFSFAQYDVSQNFTHEYLFSLEGSADATYTVTFNFDTCLRGCGNPSLSYGIHDVNGGLIDASAGGTYVLTAGAYAFQVKGDGFGAGNTVDYWGAVTITGGVAAASAIVAPAPEPGTLVLIGPGLLLIGWCVRRRKALLLVPAAIALQACSGSAPPTTPSQVVARVNGVEISVHQVSHAARLERGAVASEPDRAALLEKLIDRELAVQKALEQKLDRRIEVLQRLEEVRRDVLASAYAESLTAARGKVSASEVERFFASHPELFSRRKIYRLRELSLPADADAAAEARRRLAAREPLEAVARALSQKGVAVHLQDVIRAAEQVPLQALERLHATPEGQVALFEAPRVLFAYQVLSVQPAPLELAAARPLIAEHLTRRAGQEAMAAQMRALRASSIIERSEASLAAASDPAVTRRN